MGPASIASGISSQLVTKCFFPFGGKPRTLDSLLNKMKNFRPGEAELTVQREVFIGH